MARSGERVRSKLRPLCYLCLLLLLAACRSEPDALARVQASGMLRVALDPSFPPFEYVTDAGTLVGFDVDLAREIAAQLDVEAHFVTTGYDALYDALTVGRADVIISALYPDPLRSQDFAFTAPYFDAGDVFLLPPTSPVASQVAAPADLAGQPVMVLFGTTGHSTALVWQGTLSPPPELLVVDSPLTVTHALTTGLAAAAVLDNVTAHSLLSQEPALRTLPTMFTEEPYVIATRQEDVALQRAIEDALAHLRAEGRLAALRARWLQ